MESYIYIYETTSNTLMKLSYVEWFMLPSGKLTHTHTHTYIYMVIYIYIRPEKKTHFEWKPIFQPLSDRFHGSLLEGNLFWSISLDAGYIHHKSSTVREICGPPTAKPWISTLELVGISTSPQEWCWNVGYFWTLNSWSCGDLYIIPVVPHKAVAEVSE